MRYLRPLIVLVRPHKMRYVAERSLQKTKRMRAVLTASFSLLLAGLLFAGVQLVAVAMSGRNVVYAETHESLATIVAQDIQNTAQQPAAAQPTPGSTQTQPVPLTLDPAAIQKVIDTWQSTTKGKTSVVITDVETNQVLGSLAQDQEYFTASIYKLFVAYMALQDIDNGMHQLDDPFLNGQTRQDCLTNMIKNSDNPCAEKMLNEFVRKDLQKRIEALGVKHTSIIRFMTSAADTALLTQKIASGQGLSQSSVELLHNAMHQQKYKDALQNGFGDLDVYDKVGFYEVGWHDSAFVVLPDGRQVVVTVLTQGVGPKYINELAQRLKPLFIGV